MRNRIIVFEGPDNIGKSTMVDLLEKKLDAETLLQPNSCNSLGFLREKLKKGGLEIDSLARQLLHTCSHIVDFYEFISRNNKVLLMDRCYISALIYGAADKQPVENLKILKDIHNSVYGDLSMSFDIDLFILSSSSYKTESDGSYYEDKLDTSLINSLYREIDNDIDGYYLGSQERIHKIDVSKFSGVEETFNFVLHKIESLS